MKRILVTDVGRSPAMNFCRSLRLANDDIYILGIDSNRYSLAWAEADEKLFVDTCSETDYISLINYIIKKYNIDFVYPSKTGKELLYLSNNRDKICAKMCLPDVCDIELFEDKWKTYCILKDFEKCNVPESYMILSEVDLYENMQRLSDDFKEEVWIRRIYGSGGACALPTNDYELAIGWIRRYDGWGKFMMSKKLTPKTMTWSGLWNKGELVTSIIRERLYWEFADRTPSGVTGITGAQKLVENQQIDDMSQSIVKYVSTRPHGAICVDYTLDKDGKPYVTEIQASRLYTSSLFMTKCGLNFPYLLCKIGLDLPIEQHELCADISFSKYTWLKYVENFPVCASADLFDEFEKKKDEMYMELRDYHA